LFVLIANRLTQRTIVNFVKSQNDLKDGRASAASGRKIAAQRARWI
jgi:hypothetical protein